MFSCYKGEYNSLLDKFFFYSDYKMMVYNCSVLRDTVNRRWVMLDDDMEKVFVRTDRQLFAKDKTQILLQSL